MLALSGMLFLVPLAVPAHAAGNASLPTLTINQTAYLNGTATPGTTVTITNPISNAYAITQFTVFTPSGATFSAATAASDGTYFTGVVQSNGADVFTGSLAPGFSATETLGTLKITTGSPRAAAPPTLTFSTTIIDSSSSATYAGPVWVVWDINSATTLSVSTSAVTYVAGSAPLTITANDGTTQPGVPITLSVTTKPHAGFTATLGTTTVSTGSNGKATTTFQPSNFAGNPPAVAADATTITATIGGAFSTQTAVITTMAGAPASVSWTTGGAAIPNFNLGSTYYLNTFGNPVATPSVTLAEFSSATGLVVSMSDAYGNPLGFGALTAPTISVSVSSGAGFDDGGNALTTTGTCSNEAFSCVGLNAGSLLVNYFQGYAYGSSGSLTAIITGTYNSNFVSVSSTSGNFLTSTQAAGYTLVASSSANPVDSAGSAIKLTATPNVGTQPSVPITFNLCGQQTTRTVCLSTTIGYGGSFVGGSTGQQTGFASATSGSSGTATASYTLDTKLNNVGTWNVSSPAPTNANQKAKIQGLSGTVQTAAGPAATFAVVVYYPDQLTVVGKSIVAGQNLYASVELVDAYGNLAPNTGVTQIQVQLSATAPTTLAATTLYIQSLQDFTTFGNDQWTIPGTVAVGTPLTLTMSGVVNGVAVSPTLTITTVSPLPSLSITSPKPSSNVIYSATTGVNFKGWANVSAGYAAAGAGAVTIASVNYKVGSASWLQAAGAGPNKDAFSLSIFVPTGLSTISFNATDTKKNTVVSSAYQLLVDTQPPTFTFGSATSSNGCTTVTAASAEGDFNAASFTATYGGSPVPAASITWAGTQTLGTAGSLTATICGLVSGTAALIVTGSTLAGLSATNSESLTVTVPFASSFTFNTAGATYGLVGAYKGLTVSVTNGWNTAETVVVYATFKSGTSIYVADGTATIGAGQAASVFCVDILAIPAGSYQVTLAAVTTSNQPVSAPITPFSVTAT